MNLGGRLWTQLFNKPLSLPINLSRRRTASVQPQGSSPARCPAISGWNATVTFKKRGGLWVASESSSKIAELYGYSSHKQISGWWLSPTPLKNDGLGNSWDDEIPNWMESHKIPWFQSPPTRNGLSSILIHSVRQWSTPRAQTTLERATGEAWRGRLGRRLTFTLWLCRRSRSTRSTRSAPAPSPNGRHGHAVHGVFSHKTWQKGGKRMRFRPGDVGTGAVNHE